ncbi:MAG TPA: glycosyltransferase family 4 protein [Bryobacteraceae bacterium]|nr:glycosyltransferase family 4 protein [Bryobacteraceae bacterium]
MRILHLDSGREMRGGQWQALRLHRGLVEAGHQSVMLAREESPLLEEIRKGGLPGDVLRPLRLGLLSRQYDLVHAHDAHAHTYAALFARVPFVVSRRVAFPVRDSAVSKWKYRRARLFLAVSRHVAMQLRNARVEESRIEVIYDGVEVPREAARGDAILVPHTLDPRKGMALAQEAAGLAGVQVEITKDLAADLPRARALVYLTHSEGLGSGILLGMAYGVTVIASDVGGVPELIRDGENGILVKNDAEAVAAALQRIDPVLGAAARRTVMEQFTTERMVAATLAAYQRVMA